MSDFAAGCPGCKQHLEEIATLEAHIKQLEAKCDSLHKGKDRCMLKPEHKGCHRYWDDTTSLAWS